MFDRVPWRSIALSVIGLGVLASTAAPHLYWVEAGADAVNRSELDGTNSITVVNFEMVRCHYLAVDANAQKVYWADNSQGKIYRADLDGTDPEWLLDTPQPMGIAVDPVGGKMYWTNQQGGTLLCADLNGSNVETIHQNMPEPVGVAVDPTSGRLFWTDAGAEAIVASNLDGSAVDTLVTGLSNPIGIAVSGADGWVFWTESGSDQVSRVDMDGDNATVLKGNQSMFNLRGIAADPVRQLLFFTTDFILGRMYRMGFDGSGFAQVINGENYGPVGVAADPTTGFCYWWQDDDRAIYKTDPLVGGKEIVLAGMISPSDLARDPATGRLFWADGANIFSVSDDGTDFRHVTSAYQGSAGGIELVPSLGKVYWVTSVNLYRANYDGSAAEALGPVCDPNNPAAMALDEAAGKLYWTRTSGILQRSNLDGTGCEDLADPDLTQPTALCFHDGFLYIADDGPNQILRFDPVTTDLDTLVTGANTVLGLAVEGDKLYWSEGLNLLRRADVADGSGAETIDSLRNGPWGLATDGTVTPVRRASWGSLKGKF